MGREKEEGEAEIGEVTAVTEAETGAPKIAGGSDLRWTRGALCVACLDADMARLEHPIFSRSVGTEFASTWLHSDACASINASRTHIPGRNPEHARADEPVVSPDEPRSIRGDRERPQDRSRPVMDGDGGARSKEAEEAERRMEEEVGRAVEQAKELQDAAAAHVARSSGEEQSIRQRTLALDSSIRRLRDSIGAEASSGLLDSKLADRLEEELQRARCIMADGDASSFLPSKAQGGFVRMFLGPINVRARKEVQLKVKEEYNSYRVMFPFQFQ